MSSKRMQVNTIAKAAALAIALGHSAPLWAATPMARDGGVVSTAPPSSLAMVSDFRLAMMDDMDMMDKKGGMGGMGGMGAGRMKGNAPADGSMSADPAGSMQDPMAAPSGSDMMGRRPSMSGMAAASRLPGFPGASHLYHVGATSFFLDHPQHITLSIEQQTALNRIKEKALLDRSTSDRRIAEAEQELWTLTAADAPDAAKVDSQVRAIEKLRGDQRMAFIRAVGEAAKVLTVDQRLAVLGTKPQAASGPASTTKPAPTAPMPTMPSR